MNRSLEFAEDVKKHARDEGADLVGIAAAEALEGSPDGHPAPADLLPKARSVVVVAVKMLDAACEVSDDDVPHTAYVRTYMEVNNALDRIAYRCARFLEDAGYLALQIPATIPRYEKKWIGTLSLRKAAEQAGLGTVGVSSLLISPQFGNRQRFAAVVTDAGLAPDGPLAEDLCTRCLKCVESCPAGALSREGIDRVKCQWGTTGLYRVSGTKPPADFSLSKMAEYLKMYPGLEYYQKQSLKIGGYPQCKVCYRVCTAGVKAKERRLAAAGPRLG